MHLTNKIYFAIFSLKKEREEKRLKKVSLTVITIIYDKSVEFDVYIYLNAYSLFTNNRHLN